VSAKALSIAAATARDMAHAARAALPLWSERAQDGKVGDEAGADTTEVGG